MREELPQEEILIFSLGVLTLSLLGARLFQISGRASLWWGAIVFGWLASFWFVRKFHWQIWDVWDSLVQSFLFITIFLEAGLSLKFGVGNLLVALISLICLILGLVVSRRYKGWSWYKSGKIGIVGMSQVMSFAFGFFVLASVGSKRLYLGPNFFELLASILVLIVFGAILYKRAGRSLREDLPWLRKKSV